MQRTTRVGPAAALGAALTFALAGCASGTGSMAGAIVAEATDLPDHFLVSVSGLARAEEPTGSEGCRNPMVDPRNGTALHLVRSKDGLGDYQVLGVEYEVVKRYGVDPRHYLRVDCATGKALGIVEP